jgi:hypothetical protein
VLLAATATLAASCTVERGALVSAPVTATLSATLGLEANAHASLPVTASRTVATQVLDWWESDLQFEFAAVLLAHAVVLRVNAPSVISVPAGHGPVRVATGQGTVTTTAGHEPVTTATSTGSRSVTVPIARPARVTVNT